MHTYKFTIRCDGGTLTLVITATNLTHAIAMVLNAENCPESAILKVVKVK